MPGSKGFLCPQILTRPVELSWCCPYHKDWKGSLCHQRLSDFVQHVCTLCQTASFQILQPDLACKSSKPLRQGGCPSHTHPCDAQTRQPRVCTVQTLHACRSVDTLSVKELYSLKHETTNRALNAKMLSSLYEKPPTLGVQVGLLEGERQGHPHVSKHLVYMHSDMRPFYTTYE